MSETWRGLALHPQDPLFFRDGKPSTIGADHYLRSVFPPYPSTIFGAIRARRLLDHGVPLDRLDRSCWQGLPEHLRAELGDWGGLGSLRMRGPWLLRRAAEAAQGWRALTPAPHDLGLMLSFERTEERSEDDKEPVVKEVVRYRPNGTADQSRGWSHPLALMSPFRRRGSAWEAVDAEKEPVAPVPATRWFLTPAGLEQWARGGCPEPGELVPGSRLWCDEVRTGVGLERLVRSSEHGNLYTFGFIRLHSDVRLGLELSGGNGGLAPGSLIHLGGERRVVELQDGPGLPVPDLGQGVSGSPRWLVVSLATPCLSDGGAYPPGLGPERLQAALHRSLDGVELRLAGAVVLGSVPVGGWDIAEGRPKPMRRAIPPGSTFYLEMVRPGDLRAVAQQIHGSTLGDENLSQQGFGLAIAGVAG